jgi:hypothetical protein
MVGVLEKSGFQHRESEILRAVEILRGTTYDFRVEATIDVVALYGEASLVAALERLGAEIEPGRRCQISPPLADSASSPDL